MTCKDEVAWQEEIDNCVNSEADLKNSAQMVVSMFKLAELMWPDVNSLMARTSAVLLADAWWRGYKQISVTDWAHMMQMPRTTALRTLEEWQSKGYVRLMPCGRRTCVVGTEKGRRVRAQFLDGITTRHKKAMAQHLLSNTDSKTYPLVSDTDNRRG